MWLLDAVSDAKRLDENFLWKLYKSNGLHGQNLCLISGRVVFILERFVYDPFGEDCYVKVKVKQFF